MAEMIIMLRRDPQTGKQSIVIKLHSDPDALPHEHEQLHRELVEKALGRKLEDAEEIIIEREPVAAPVPEGKSETSDNQKQAQGRSNWVARPESSKGVAQPTPFEDSGRATQTSP